MTFLAALILQSVPPSPSALTTLDTLLNSISHELEVPVSAKGRLGKRLVYCRMTAQPAARQLMGLAKALDLKIERTEGKSGFRLVPYALGGESNRDRVGRGWQEFVALVDGDAVGTAAEVQRRRASLSLLMVEDSRRGLSKTPKGRERARKATSLMRIEEPTRLFLYRQLRRLKAQEVAAPYETPPTATQWRNVTQEAHEFGLAANPSVGPFLTKPETILILQPSKTYRGLAWQLVALSPESSLPLESLQIELAEPKGEPLKHELPAELESMTLALHLDRPKDDFLTLGSVAKAVRDHGRSFAAWCPSTVVSFRIGTGTFAQIEEDARDSIQIRFRDCGDGWIGVRTDSPLPFVDRGIEWSKTLSVLDLYDSGRLDREGFRRYLNSLSRDQLSALAGAWYENPNLGVRYSGLADGALLFRSAFDGATSQDRRSTIQEVRSLRPGARNDVLAFLRTATFIEAFPALFHPRSILDPNRFQLETQVEAREGHFSESVKLTALTSHQKTPIAAFHLELAPSTPNNK